MKVRIPTLQLKWAVLALVLAMVIVAPVMAGGRREAVDPGEQRYTWRFAHEEPPEIYQDLYAKEFARRMHEQTNGRVTINVYPLGTLGGDLDVFEALTDGAIEFVISSPGVSASIVPEAQFLLLHFVFSDNMAVNNEVLLNWRESTAFQEIADTYATMNAKVLSFWHEGWMSWTANKAIRTPSDFRGVDFRVMRSPLIIESYRAYGANPTPMPFAEVYNAMQLGMIDGQENPEYYIYANKLHQVQNYIIKGNHGFFTNATLVGQAFFEGLPMDLQEMIVTTIDDMHPWADAMQRELNDRAVADMLGENPRFNVIELSSAERERFRAASEHVQEAYVRMMSDPDSARERLNALIDAINETERRLGN